MNTINDTNFQFPKQKAVYKGKVREVYSIDDTHLVMIASDRLSAFDVILPRQIPYKGQILNQIATKMLQETAAIVPNWLLATPDENVAIGHLCEPFKVEMVIRGYMSGHAAREYKAGKRTLCGVSMPEGLQENDPFPSPIITPSTKADNGAHDEDITREAILSKGIVSEEDYLVLEDYTRKLFQRGTEIAASRGLILVDTKYEFGKTKEGEIMLIDEIHTPDSSRYWIESTYKERIEKAEEPQNIDKEFLRLWFVDNCDPYNDSTLPEAPDDLVIELSSRYIYLYETITGGIFPFPDSRTSINERIKNKNFFERTYL